MRMINQEKKKKHVPKGTDNQAPRFVPFGVTRQVATRKESDTALGAAYFEDLNRLFKEEYLRNSLRFRFDPTAWLEAAQRAQNQGPAFSRALRCLVQVGTLATLLRGWYTLPQGETIHLSRKRLTQSARQAALRNYESDVDLVESRFIEEMQKYYGSHQGLPTLDAMGGTRIILSYGDVLDTTFALQRALGVRAKSTAVLVNGSYNMPGGGWKKGAAALEENLHRRTSLVEALEDPYRMRDQAEWIYPLPCLGGLAVPGACVFRGSEEHGYEYLPRPQFLSFVVGWAFKMPPLVPGPSEDDSHLSKRERRTMFVKIATWLDMAMQMMEGSPRPRIFVATPIGCGVYGNPPREIARLFAMVLAMPRFVGAFDVVAFSILDGPSDQPGVSYYAFHSILEPLLTYSCPTGIHNQSSESILEFCPIPTIE